MWRLVVPRAFTKIQLNTTQILLYIHKVLATCWLWCTCSVCAFAKNDFLEQFYLHIKLKTLYCHRKQEEFWNRSKTIAMLFFIILCPLKIQIFAVLNKISFAMITITLLNITLYVEFLHENHQLQLQHWAQS